MIYEIKTELEQTAWSRSYQRAFRRFLSKGASGSLLPATKLGRRAVTLGLETLDVARFHEQILTTLSSSASAAGSTPHEVAKQAKLFFSETIAPIAGTHSTAIKANLSIDRLTQTLRQRTKQSVASDKQLKAATAQRKAAETVLEQFTDRHTKLLVEAEHLQKSIRHQTRKILMAQEDEQDRAACELRNEIAQALIAIDLSLLILKTSAIGQTGKLEKKIANSMQLMRQFHQGVRERDPKNRKGGS